MTTSLAEKTEPSLSLPDAPRLRQPIGLTRAAGPSKRAPTAGVATPRTRGPSSPAVESSVPTATRPSGVQLKSPPRASLPARTVPPPASMSRRAPAPLLRAKPPARAPELVAALPRAPAPLAAERPRPLAAPRSPKISLEARPPLRAEPTVIRHRDSIVRPAAARALPATPPPTARAAPMPAAPSSQAARVAPSLPAARVAPPVPAARVSPSVPAARVAPPSRTLPPDLPSVVVEPRPGEPTLLVRLPASRDASAGELAMDDPDLLALVPWYVRLWQALTTR